MDQEELLEKLSDVSDELGEIENSLKPYQDDIEEGNYDGDSIELTTHTAECESEIDEILKVMKAKDYEIPEGYQEAADEL